MDQFVQNLINGAMMGCIYAMIALGLSIVYGVMNVINFAHGDFVMLSMYATFWLGTLWALDPVFSPVLTFPLLFLIGVIVYWLLIDRTLRQAYTTQVAVTVGLMLFLRAVTTAVFRSRPRAINFQSVFHGAIELGPYTILHSRLFGAIVAILAIVAVWIFLQRTWAGRAVRAASDDLTAASLVGLNPRRIYAITLGLGSALTAIAGALLMVFGQVDPTMGVRYGLLSWAVLALSGLGSMPGLMISGVIVGWAESITQAYWNPEARSLGVYAIFMLVLWFRPRGLFGRK